MEENLTDSTIQNILRVNTEGNEQTSKTLSITNRNRNIFLLKNYYKNSYNLENQALRNSFGKMIKSKNDTSPKFSFGKEKRFYQEFKKDDINYYTNMFNKINNNIKKPIDNNNSSITYKILKLRNFKNPQNYFDKIKTINLSSGVKCPTDFLYYPPPTNIYKYPFLPKFSFGTGLRDLQKPIKPYAHYYLSYNKKTDDENLDRKWRKRIVGGDIGTGGRFSEDKKLFNESVSPGPGRYNPNYIFFKYNQNKGGYMGIKLSEVKDTVFTDRPKKLSLNSYNIKHMIGTNNSHKTLDKNIRLKIFRNDGKFNRDNNNYTSNKFQFRNIKKLFNNKINDNQNNVARTNISFNL